MHQFAKTPRVSQSGHPQRKHHLVVTLSLWGRAVLEYRTKQNVPQNWMEDTELELKPGGSRPPQARENCAE